MTATERLRELLDERGVEYETEDRPTIRYTEWGDWVFSEPLDAKPHTLGAQCELMCIPVTPEQAIVATLGAGTCELHDCEGIFSVTRRPIWRCDCGAFMTQYTDATTYHKPRFCPNCGRRVVDE